MDRETLFEQLLKKIPAKGVIPKLFVVSGGVVLVHLKSFKINKNKEESQENKSMALGMNNLLSSALSKEAFSSWLSSAKNSSRIKISPAVFKN